MITLVGAETALVVTVKFARLLPCEMLTLAGTVATAVLPLLNETMAPPGGADDDNVT